MEESTRYTASGVSVGGSLSVEANKDIRVVVSNVGSQGDAQIKAKGDGI